MADYRILIEADTAKAEKDLKRVDTVADAAARDRKLNFGIPNLNDVNNGVERLKTSIEGAANNIKLFYGVSKGLPVIGDKVRNAEEAFVATRSAIDAANESINRGVSAGDLLSRTFEKVSSGADFLVTNLAKIGFALFGLQKVVEVLQGAFGKLFAETIGREIQLRETLLKTQTTVASMSDVFVGGKKITDPLEKIKALTGSVEKNIDSIRERSLELAGVTSSEVVEVFGIVAGQIGQVGGGLKDAEDLAISFAAALGTFGIPLQQARQEITSMLQGNIGPDSYLARALGITNPDIAKARTQAGGVIKFIQDKLATAVAGQKLAAQSFSGVMSNIRELGELIGQKFGRGLLDPLLAGITFIYNKLGLVKDVLYDIAERAGAALGAIARIAATKISLNLFGGSATDDAIKRAGETAKAVASTVFSELQRVATTTIAAIIQIIDALKPAFLTVADTVARLAKTFLEIQVGQFQAVLTALANIVSIIGPAVNAIASLVNAWSRFLDLPILQYVSEVAAVLGLLKRMGLDTAMMIVSMGGFMLNVGVPAIVKIGVAAGGFIVTLGLLVAALANVGLAIAGMAGAFLAPAAAIPALQAGLIQFIGSMKAASAQAAETGASLNVLGAGMQGVGAASKSMALSLVASLGKFALFQVAIAVLVDLFGRYQRAQQQAARSAEVAEALKFVSERAGLVKGSMDGATQAMYDYQRAVAEAGKGEIVAELVKVTFALEKQKKAVELLNESMARPQAKAVARDYLLKLQKDYERLTQKLKEYGKVLDAIKEEEAAAYANSPKGRVEQLQKEFKVKQDIANINAQEDANAIKRAQVYGQLNAQDAARLTMYTQLRDLTTQIGEKQSLLTQIKLLDPSNLEEINKIKAELAGLEGKQLDVQLALRKEQFEQDLAAIQARVQEMSGQIELEIAVTTNVQKVAEAQASAEKARLDYVVQVLEYEQSIATTAEAQWAIAQQIFQVKIAQADVDYRMAMLNIATSIRLAQLEAKRAEIKVYEAKATAAAAAAAGQWNKAHQQAIEAAQQAAAIAWENYDATVQMAAYQEEAAVWQRQSAIFAAQTALEQQKVAIFSKDAASSAADYANSMGQAANAARSINGSQEVPVDLAGNPLSGVLETDTHIWDANTQSYIEKSAPVKPKRRNMTATILGPGPSYLYQQQKAQEIVDRFNAPMMGLPGYVPYDPYGALKDSAAPDPVNLSSLSTSTQSPFSSSTASPNVDINVNTGPVMEFDGTKYVTLTDLENAMRTTASGVIGRLRTPASRIALGIA